MERSLAPLLRDASAPDGGARQTRAAARLMSLLEAEPHRLPELFRDVPAAGWPQPRLVLGVTGAPGSGKSTLTDRLLSEYRRRWPDRRLGVVAVDPSSPFSGGSVLGDRVRMMRHATDPYVFIRSLATRGHLGGLTLGVRGVLRVMGLIGCDVVIVETVGVGQSEVEVAAVADIVAVVLAPGQGDAVQLLKAGLMEVGDLFVLNKADREGAGHLHSQLLSTLALLSHDAERPDVLLTTAADGSGIPELADALDARALRDRDRWLAARTDAVEDAVRASVLEAARRRLDAALDTDHLRRVLDGETTVGALAHDLLAESARAVAPAPAPRLPVSS